MDINIGVAEEDKYGHYIDLTIDNVSQRFRKILSGEFMMGSSSSEAERLDNEEQRNVNIDSVFWMADTACTQAFWQVVMGGNPSQFKDNENNPVEHVSWNTIQVFLENINQHFSQGKVSLPSDEEWEYSCRAGTDTAFSFGDQITPAQANYNSNFLYNGIGDKGGYREKVLPVNAFPANDWGLYQMHGNVWEWCKNINNDDTCTLRGGSWRDVPTRLRSAHRSMLPPDVDGGFFGFRLAAQFDSQ